MMTPATGDRVVIVAGEIAPGPTRGSARLRRAIEARQRTNATGRCPICQAVTKAVGGADSPDLARTLMRAVMHERRCDVGDTRLFPLARREVGRGVVIRDAVFLVDGYGTPAARLTRVGEWSP